MRTVKRSAAACSVALVLVILAAVSSAMAAPVVYVGNQAEPRRLAVKQGGNYRRVSIGALSWSGWNQAATVGRGVYSFRFCAPETGACADQPFYDEPALVTLSRIVRCRGRAYYTRLKVTSDGPVLNSLFKPFRASIGACRVKRRSDVPLRTS